MVFIMNVFAVKKFVARIAIFVVCALFFGLLSGCNAFYRTYHMPPAEFAKQVEEGYTRKGQQPQSLSASGYCASRVNRLRCKDQSSGRTVNQPLSRWSGRYCFVQNNGKAHWLKSGDVYVYNDQVSGYRFVVDGSNESYRAVELEDVKFRRSRGWTGVITFGLSSAFYTNVP